MITKDYELIKENADFLARGEYGRPVEARGSAACRRVLRSLEALRVRLRDEECAALKAAGDSGRAVAAAVHDLKTPISVMLGYAECIRDGMDDKDYMSLLEDKLKGMSESVAAILSDVRAKGEKEPFEKTDAGDLLGKVYRQYKGAAESRGVALLCGRPAQGNVILRRKEAESALGNIITNALNYTPEKGKIRISSHTYGSRYYIKVKDNGCGISAKNLPYIFDKGFSTGDGRMTKGSGLGLDFVKNAVNNAGGSIKVRSKQGKGSAFFISYPMACDDRRNGALTYRFENNPVAVKALCVTFTLGLASLAYRIMRFAETLNPLKLLTVWLYMVLGVALWVFDLISLAVCGRIRFLT